MKLLTEKDLHTVNLDTDQADLITCLLLDQLLEINRTEEEIYRMYEAYAEFLQTVKSGVSPKEPRFIAELETLRELVKNEQPYADRIDTIIALWNG